MLIGINIDWQNDKSVVFRMKEESDAYTNCVCIVERKWTSKRETKNTENMIANNIKKMFAAFSKLEDINHDDYETIQVVDTKTHVKFLMFTKEDKIISKE